MNSYSFLRRVLDVTIAYQSCYRFDKNGNEFLGENVSHDSIDTSLIDFANKRTT